MADAIIGEPLHIKGLTGCARCRGEGHVDLTFEPLAYPLDLNDGSRPLTHWAPCPTNGQPILLSQANEDPPTPLQQWEVREYLDAAVTLWRARRDALNEDDPARHTARCYIDAFQSVRSSLLGETLP
jgi:hypothetical protein